MKGKHVECGANADLITLNMHHDFITDADRQTLFTQIFYAAYDSYQQALGAYHLQAALRILHAERGRMIKPVVCCGNS